MKDIDELKHALEYASRGWRVLPVYEIVEDACSCVGPCSAPGKHPRIKNWQGDASTSPDTIRKWWQKWPAANVALATGAESGIFVIDIDGPDGAQTLQRWADEHQGLPETLTALSGRGKHLYFAHPGQWVKTRSNVGKGIDVRGDGGYIIAPPSIHASGTRYRWEGTTELISAAPNWLLEVIGSNATSEVKSASSVDDDVIPVGARNDTLFGQACAMRGRGLEYEDIEKQIMAINQQKCEAPLSDLEIESIAKSAAKFPAGEVTPSGDPSRKATSPLWWFPLNVNEWCADTNILLMKDYQVGWYIWLLVECWKSKGILPNDPAKLAIMARSTSRKKFMNEMASVMGDFQPSKCETQLVNRKFHDLWRAKTELVAKNKEKGEKSAAGRTGKNSVTSFSEEGDAA